MPLKKIKPYFILTICFFYSNFIYATDTLRMMQYNLMYYTLSAPDDCNVSQAYLNNKNANLKKIVQYARPDVICVNEIGTDLQYVQSILNNALNNSGVYHYEHCPVTHLSYYSSIGNMLYYNSDKLKFHSHFTVITHIRDINAYRLYYKSPDLAHGDTVFITFIIAHLKAGGYDSDIAQRAYETRQLMSRLETIGRADNYIFSGDFNITSSSEECYQNVTNPANSLYTFYDPLDAPGNWNNNSSFAYLHTQSTHTYVNSGDCFSSGGMDDRFDFILLSSYLYYGLNGAKALRDTYHALGQDGNRFNGSIIYPTNNFVPNEISNALYNLSDHLPVLLDLEINATPQQVITVNSELNIEVVNPVTNNQLSLIAYCNKSAKLEFNLISLEGKVLLKFVTQIEKESCYRINEPLDNIPSGFYLLSVTDEQQNRRIVKKVVKL